MSTPPSRRTDGTSCGVPRSTIQTAAWTGWSGDAITGLLTDIPAVQQTVEDLIPLVVALPVVAVACYQFDGIFIAATAASAMMVTMALAFTVYILTLQPLANHYGLQGLWAAVLIFMAIRGITQALWYPRLESKLNH